jgi:hypothetical protein
MLDSAAAVSQEAVDLWSKSFQGEVLGEAYFSRMSQMATDPKEKEKLEALATLERCTKELLVPSMDRLGISTDPDQGAVEVANALAAEYDYPAMLGSLPTVTGEYLGYYSRLRELVDEQDAGAVNLLIAHEMALELFARRESAGESETSLDPIRALPHVSL